MPAWEHGGKDGNDWLQIRIHRLLECLKLDVPEVVKTSGTITLVVHLRQNAACAVHVQVVDASSLSKGGVFRMCSENGVEGVEEGVVVATTLGHGVEEV